MRRRGSGRRAAGTFVTVCHGPAALTPVIVRSELLHPSKQNWTLFQEERSGNGSVFLAVPWRFAPDAGRKPNLAAKDAVTRDPARSCVFVPGNLRLECRMDGIDDLRERGGSHAALAARC